MVTITLRGLIL